MANLIQCKDGYTCFESLLEFLLTIFFLFYQIISYRIILKDRSGVLVQIDRILCLASLIQTLIQAAYFLYFDTDFMLSTIRCMGIAMQVMLCNILGSIIADDDSISRIWLLARTLLGLTFVEWFWLGIIHGSIIDYNCVQIDYLIFSSTGLILALGALYMGSLALDGLCDYRDKMEVAKKGSLQMRQYNQQYEHVMVRIEQITLMHYCGLLQFGFQFCFDLFTYIQCETMGECSTYYNATSFLWVAFLVKLKLVSFSTIPLTMFLIFYEKNKNKFTEVKEENIGVEMSEG